MSKVLYLGNPKKLKPLQKGDLVLGAEGFEKGRSVVVTEHSSKIITNIHGIILRSTTHDVALSIFVRCFLAYLREKGAIDKFAVGGNGGSFAMKYWDKLMIPTFPSEVRKEIVQLYHTGVRYPEYVMDVSEFREIDETLNGQSGVLDLDLQIKTLKNMLDRAILSIIDDDVIETPFRWCTQFKCSPN